MDFISTSSKLRSSEYIRERLLSNDKIVSLVGDKIYPMKAPNINGDYIVLSRTSYEVVDTKAGICSRRCNVLVEVFSDEYDRSLDIAEAIDNFFTNLRENDNERHSFIGLVEAVEVVVDGKFVQVLEYTIE